MPPTLARRAARNDPTVQRAAEVLREERRAFEDNMARYRKLMDKDETTEAVDKIDATRVNGGSYADSFNIVASNPNFFTNVAYNPSTDTTVVVAVPSGRGL